LLSAKTKVVAICAAIEAEITELNDEGRAVFLDDIGVSVWWTESPRLC